MKSIAISKWSVVWCDGVEVYERKGLDSQAVLGLILQIHENATTPKPVVEVFSIEDKQPSISIAMGGLEAVVTFESSIEPPYYISLGDSQRKGVTEPFYHGNQVIEHLASNLVPWESARRVLEEFLRSQKRSSCIQWEQL